MASVSGALPEHRMWMVSESGPILLLARLQMYCPVVTLVVSTGG